MSFAEWFRLWRAGLAQASRDAAAFERETVITVDDQGIAAAYPDGTRRAIRWADVERIVIETNDTGPWGSDFWWVVEGGGSHCAFPQGATGEAEATRALPDRFPGFDFQAMISAATCTDNARFTCWTRPLSGSGGNSPAPPAAPA